MFWFFSKQGTVDTPKTEPSQDNNVDEKEVWALRAQALKSLACKRASKVKMAKKVRILSILWIECMKCSL